MSSVKKKLKRLGGGIYVRAVRLFGKIDENTVLFESFNGKNYSDNPRAISERLHTLYPNVRICWALKKPASFRNVAPDYVNVISYGDKKVFWKAVATSGTIVTNFPLMSFPKHRKQYLIQTCHGDRGMKRVYLDSPFASGKMHLAEQDEGFCDLGIAGSSYAEKNHYRSGMGYNGTLLRTGTPRCDCLLKQDQSWTAAVRKRLNIDGDTGVLLYAPTLRRENNKNKTAQKIQQLDIAAALDLLEKKYQKKWICLLRSHPNVSGITGYASEDRMLDVSGYDDMMDILAVSDVLITDYSSSAGDFALLNRLVILYQPDRDEYLKKDRDFYFDIDSSPFFVAASQKALEQIMEDADEAKIRENCEAILSFYGSYETGHASDDVVKCIADFHNWK